MENEETRFTLRQTGESYDVNKVPFTRYSILGTDDNEMSGYYHEPSRLYFIAMDLATIYESEEQANEAIKNANPKFTHELVETKVTYR